MRSRGNGRPTGRPRARPVFSKRGAALLMALSGVVVVGILASALGALVLAGIRSARISSRDDVLLNMAESAVELAMSRLARDPAWRGAEKVPVPGGACRVSVSPRGNGGFQVTSRALPTVRKNRARGSGARTCTVRVRVERTRAGPPAFSVTEWDADFEQ